MGESENPRSENGSGSAVDSSDQSGAKKPSDQILREELSEGITALRRPNLGLFISGLSAGLEVGFSLLLMATLRERMNKGLNEGVGELLLALMYAVGFIFVTVGRSELFTEHTTLALLPVVAGKKRVRDPLRLWGLVYSSNLLGAATFAWVASFAAPMTHMADAKTFGEISRSIVEHPPSAIIFSAILAGWLMGLLSWLVTAARDTISQVTIVFIVAGAIGFMHLHHCVAGTVEVLTGAFSGTGASAAEYGKFLLFSTIGNALGGIFFVALVKYSHATRMDPYANADDF